MQHSERWRNEGDVWSIDLHTGTGHTIAFNVKSDDGEPVNLIEAEIRGWQVFLAVLTGELPQHGNL